MPKQAHLFQFLTQEEWSLCFALAFLQDFEAYDDAYPLKSYSSSGEGEDSDTWEEDFRRAIRLLQFEHGYAFRAVVAKESGRIRGSHPVAPPNYLYAELLKDGKMPNVLVNLKRAIDFAEREVPSLPRDALLDAYADVRASVENVEKATRPEDWKRWEEMADEALRSLGIERLDKGEPN